MEWILWPAVLLCLVQSGIFSGLNLALFGLSRVRLEIEAQGGNLAAQKVLALRRDANRLLTTILWGNVAVNCLLTVLLDSVFAGAAAFLVSTFGITLCGEIFPQAYFSRNALRMGAALAPLVRFYQLLLSPVAWPTALLLDRWLGEEATNWFQERDLHHLLRSHVESPDAADIGRLEGVGALNFLALDDLSLREESLPLDSSSVLVLPREHSGLAVPRVRPHPTDPFLQKVNASGRKWVILVDPEGEPRWALDVHRFLRSALFEGGAPDPLRFCHRPIVIRDEKATVETALEALHANVRALGTDVIDRDVVLFWGSERRILTGADLFGRLLRDVPFRDPAAAEGEEPPIPGRLPIPTVRS